MSKRKETPEEMRARLEGMADAESDKWDLSDNDRAAIVWMLDRIDSAVDRAEDE